MKTLFMKYCLLAVIGFALFVSCKKDVENSMSNELNGTWELRLVEGGYSYQHTLYQPGNGNIIQFSNSNQYSLTNLIDSEQITMSGKYNITYGATCYSNDISFISFSDEGISNASILSVLNDSLYLKANNCVMADGVDKTYVKVE